MALVGLQAPQGSAWPVTGMTGLLMQASSFKTGDSSDGGLWRQACLSVNLAKKFLELGCSLTLLTQWRLLRPLPSHHPSSLHCLQLFPLPPPLAFPLRISCMSNPVLVSASRRTRTNTGAYGNETSFRFPDYLK